MARHTLADCPEDTIMISSDREVGINIQIQSGDQVVDKTITDIPGLYGLVGDLLNHIQVCTNSNLSLDKVQEWVASMTNIQPMDENLIKNLIATSADTQTIVYTMTCDDQFGTTLMASGHVDTLDKFNCILLDCERSCGEYDAYFYIIDRSYLDNFTLASPEELLDKGWLISIGAESIDDKVDDDERRLEAYMEGFFLSNKSNQQV